MTISRRGRLKTMLAAAAVVGLMRLGIAIEDGEWP